MLPPRNNCKSKTAGRDESVRLFNTKHIPNKRSVTQSLEQFIRGSPEHASQKTVAKHENAKSDSSMSTIPTTSVIPHFDMMLGWEQQRHDMQKCAAASETLFVVVRFDHPGADINGHSSSRSKWIPTL